MNKNSFLRKSLLAILVFSLLVSVFSQKSIAALMYNNTYSTATSAGVASDGTMTIYMAYDGIQGVTYEERLQRTLRRGFWDYSGQELILASQTINGLTLYITIDTVEPIVTS